MELKRTFPTWKQIATIEDVEGKKLQISRHQDNSGSLVGIQFGGGSSEDIWIADLKNLKQLDDLLTKMTSSDTLTAGSVTDLYEVQIRVEKILNNLWTVAVEMPQPDSEKKKVEIKLTLDEPNAKKLKQKVNQALKG
jgi:hypothetical protein